MLFLLSPLHISSMLSSSPSLSLVFHISSKLCATQAQELSRALEMEWARNEVREVGGEIFGAAKGAEKSMGRGRGCVFGSSPKRLEWPGGALVAAGSLQPATTTTCTCSKECNKYDDSTAAQCFWLAYQNDWSRWFPISSPPPLCCPNFSFMGEVAKSK